MNTTKVLARQSKQTQIAAFLSSIAVVAAGAVAQCAYQELHANFPDSGAGFGWSVSSKGQSAIVGAARAQPYGTGNGSFGRIQFLTQFSGGYGSPQEFISTLPENNALFGNAVAMSDSISVSDPYACAATPLHSAYGIGSVGMVEMYHKVGATWYFDGSILPPQAYAAAHMFFGGSISVSDNRVAIGAPGDESFGVPLPGAVYIYRRNISGVWALEQRVSLGFLTFDAMLGYSVALTGNTLVVGAPRQNTALARSGETFIFKFSGGAWNLASGISGNTAGARMGTAVAASSNLIASAASGNHQLVMVRDAGAGGFQTVLDTTLPTNALYAAHSLAFDDSASHLVAGNFDLDGDNATVDIYETFNGTFRLRGVIPSQDNQHPLGSSVAMGSAFILAGSEFGDAPGVSAAGSVLVMPPFTLAGEDCTSAVSLDYLNETFCTASMRPGYAESCIGPLYGPDAWFRFDPACVGLYRLTTYGSNFDTVLSVFDGCGPDANLLACNDDFASPQRWSQVTVNVTGPVYIRVAGYNGLAGIAQLNSYAVGYANETADTATPIVEGTTNFCTYGARSDPLLGAFNCGNGPFPTGSDLWYSYTPSCSSQATITTCGSAFDTVLQVFDQVPQSNSEAIACNDDACPGAGSRVEVDVQAGHTYLIRVGGYNNAQGTGALTLSTLVSCPADYNQDGGIDGSDVSAFFADWQAGALSSDVNCDGGIDGSDVSVFFAAWQNGGC